MAPTSFPTELPPRTQPVAGQTWKQRNCPGMRSCWTFSLSSYSLKTSDTAVLARRICMITILGLRTAMSVLAIIYDAYGRRLVSFILGVILAVLGFLFIAWCLAVIGEMKGYRKVLGARIGRWHFDIFLLGTAIIHIGLLIGAFFSLRHGGLSGSWLALWLCIFGAAWVATWEPEPESNV